jgi:hypothetical protein
MKNTLFVLIAAIAPAASLSAKTHDSSSEACVQVVGHLSLDGAQASHLFVRQSDRGRRYLYAAPVEGHSVVIVNISDPSHPVIEGRMDYQDQNRTGDVTPVGRNAAIVEIAEHTGVERGEAAALRNIGVMDLSDPAHPKIACRFADVSGYLSDASKSLIYIVNSEGLWIVRHHEPLDVSAEAWEKFAAAP